MTKPILHSSVGSQHSRRVRVLIEELEIDVEVREVPFGPEGFGGENRGAFLALNPNGKVPVLEHGELVLWESNAIMWYLAEEHGPNPLWPNDSRERAQISMWQLWQAAHLSSAADGLFYENLAKPVFMKVDPDPAAVERHTAAFHRWMKVMETALDGSDYLALGRFTCADIAVAGALMYADKANMPYTEHPNVAAWRARICERASWAATETPAS